MTEIFAVLSLCLSCHEMRVSLACAAKPGNQHATLTKEASLPPIVRSSACLLICIVSPTVVACRSEIASSFAVLPSHHLAMHSARTERSIHVPHLLLLSGGARAQAAHQKNVWVHWSTHPHGSHSMLLQDVRLHHVHLLGEHLLVLLWMRSLSLHHGHWSSNTIAWRSLRIRPRGWRWLRGRWLHYRELGLLSDVWLSLNIRLRYHLHCMTLLALLFHGSLLHHELLLLLLLLALPRSHPWLRSWGWDPSSWGYIWGYKGWLGHHLSLVILIVGLMETFRWNHGLWEEKVGWVLHLDCLVHQLLVLHIDLVFDLLYLMLILRFLFHQIQLLLSDLVDRRSTTRVGHQLVLSSYWLHLCSIISVSSNLLSGLLSLISWRIKDFSGDWLIVSTLTHSSCLVLRTDHLGSLILHHSLSLSLCQLGILQWLAYLLNLLDSNIRLNNLVCCDGYRILSRQGLSCWAFWVHKWLGFLRCSTSRLQR